MLLRFLLATILVSGTLQASAQGGKKYNFPSGTSARDFVPGRLWVKINPKYKSAFQSNDGVRIKSQFNNKQFDPLDRKTKSTKSGRTKSGGTPNVDISLIYQVSFDPALDLAKTIIEFEDSGFFEVVEPVKSVQVFTTPSDTYVAQQYYLNLIHAYEAWDITKGSESIVIGIIDTGGDLNHPDLKDQLYINAGDPEDGIDNDNDGYIDNYRGWDFSGSDENLISTPGFVGDNDPSIFKGGSYKHGTEVAGCASASTDNGVGISGTGYNTKLLFTKHFADNQVSQGYTSDLYLGVYYAATHGAKIINCSWGNNSYSAIEQDIISYVTLELGCLVVAAAGNSNSDVPFYPASYDYVLSVASTDINDIKSPNSSFGEYVDVSAPGLNILTTTYDDGYAFDSGTSLAAPIVAGGAALVWANNPSLSPLQVLEQIKLSADKSFYSKNPSYVNQLGSGRLDILNALTFQGESIHVGNIALIKPNTGMIPEPGENAKLSIDFINFLAPSSDKLSVSVQIASSYISSNSFTKTLGVISSMDTLHTFFNLVLDENIPLQNPIDIKFKFTDGTYSHSETITFSFPIHKEVSENNITTSLTSIGRIGFANTEDQSEGVGFLYDGNQLLSQMGVIMGTSSTNISNNVIGDITNDQDFTPSSNIKKITPGERSYAEVTGSFRNSDEATNASLIVSFRSMVWQKEPLSHFNDFVIIEYKIKNATAVDVNNFYFGIFADWRITSDGQGDRADWYEPQNLWYAFAARNSSLPFCGIQLLKGNAHFLAIDNDESVPGSPFGLYDGFTDDEKFDAISGVYQKKKSRKPYNRLQH